MMYSAPEVYNVCCLAWFSHRMDFRMVTNPSDQKGYFGTVPRIKAVYSASWTSVILNPWFIVFLQFNYSQYVSKKGKKITGNNSSTTTMYLMDVSLRMGKNKYLLNHTAPFLSCLYIILYCAYVVSSNVYINCLLR